MNDFVPDSQFVEDAPTRTPSTGASSGFVPDSDFVSDEDKYGTLGQQAKTFGEGALKAIPFFGGVALKELQRLGIEGPNSDIDARAQAHPITNFLGGAAGVLGSLAVAPEAEFAGVADILNPISGISKIGKAVDGALETRIVSGAAKSAAQKVLGKATTSAVASGVEGSLFSAGGVLNDMILGDPHMNGEKAVSEIGMGALLGGGFGAALGGLGEAASLAKNNFFKAGAAKSMIQDGAAKEASNVPLAATEGMGPANAPRTLEEIEARTKTAPQALLSEPMPSKTRLSEAEKLIPDSQFPAHELQYSSLDDPNARMVYKTYLEGNTDEAQNLRNYESLQKNEAVNLTKETIDKIAPAATLTDDAVRGGQHAIDTFQRQYESEKDALKPLFKRFDKAAVNPIEAVDDLVGKLEEAIPSVSNYLTMDEGNSTLKLAKYEPTMPFSETAHGAIKDLVTAVNKPDLTLGELRNLRESMRDKLNLLSPARDYSQIGGLRKSLMDFMENEIQKAEPDLAVRDLFKRYALNEQDRTIIEKLLRGKIGDAASFANGKMIKPEEVLNRLFSDSVSVKAAKNVLGNDFQTVLGNFLKSKMEEVTDSAKNGFSSNKFATFLKGKTPELSAALEDKPEVLARLKALTDKMRILPDSPPANPSGTADKILSVLGGIKKVKGLLSPLGAIKGALDKLVESSSESRNKSLINEMLQGRSYDEAVKGAEKKAMGYGILKNIEDTTQAAQLKIQSGAKSVFRTASDVAGFAGAATAKRLTKDEALENNQASVTSFEKKRNRLLALSQNPEQMMNHLEETTKDIYEHAPNISSGIQQAAANAIGFLASQVPHAFDQRPLSPKWEPSKSEISKFNKLYQTINKPASVFAHIKDGTLSSDQVQAISQVYPKLYEEMKSQLMEQIVSKKDKIPYKTKLMLSQFMGEDLDLSTTQTSIQMNQAAINGPSKQAENQPMGNVPVRASQKGLQGLSASKMATNSLQQSAQRINK